MKIQNSQFRAIIKSIIPKFMLNFITRFFYGWSGNYSSWEEAIRKSTGYDAKNILEKVKDATLKVKDEIVPYERDSVVFDEIQYSFPLLSGLMWIAAQNKGKLNVLDFGGSLGSSYYQNKLFLDSLIEIKWCIVEQHNFVSAGKEHFEDDKLKFYYSIDECLEKNEIDVILFSSVLQYLEKPYDLLEHVKSSEIKFLIIDRTPFIKGNDRITVQKVHPKIYKAKYPCWFFNMKKFLSYIEREYELFLEFDSLDRANIDSTFKGFLFKLKETNQIKD
ncbi:TIGR04325 family methyltransferase [Bacteroidota bacterium]